MDMHPVAQSGHERCEDLPPPACAQMLEQIAIAGAQPGPVHDGKLALPALSSRAASIHLALHHTARDRAPDPPDPPGRVYLRLLRLLI
ncbi:MAG: hypothetical protein EXR27_15670 [Betaproteobacteria bacterium]|nr:hypothetical protein [Betaproteobacteria bacterium]